MKNKVKFKMRIRIMKKRKLNIKKDILRQRDQRKSFGFFKRYIYGKQYC